MAAAADISVVIPSYNAAAFVRSALESVFAQTRPPLEIVVADDASRDDTLAIVTGMAADAPVPVRVVRMARNSGGPPAPLNAGIREARGTHIAVLEQDDAMFPARLELQRACLDAEPALGLVFCKCLCVTERGEEESPDLPFARSCGSGPDRLAAELRQSAIGNRQYRSLRISRQAAYEALVDGMFALTCSAFLFPKKVWGSCGGFDEDIASSCDYGFIQKVAARHDIGFVDGPLVRWRRRDDSLYRTSGRLERYADLLRILTRFDGRLLGGAARRRLRARIRAEASGAAFFSRKAGARGAAWRYYLASLARGGISGEALRGLVALGLQCVRRPAGKGGVGIAP